MKQLLIPFIIQAFAMFFDEFYFHRGRRLTAWEAYGHPLDTLSVVTCYAYLIRFQFSQEHLLIYFLLAGFSCLLVTKDEWVHQKYCKPAEHWLHSVLFILHPCVLGLAGWMWTQPNFEKDFRNFILFQEALAIAFMSYQFLYWRTRFMRPAL